jgi:transposase
MLQTCKMNGVYPYAWAKLTLERIANRWPNSDIKALMPWNLKPYGATIRMRTARQSG